MTAARACGIPADRLYELARRHAGSFARLHQGAAQALALDEDVSPDEMIALMKHQLVSGLVGIVTAQAELVGVHAGVQEIVEQLTIGIAAFERQAGGHLVQ